MSDQRKPPLSDEAARAARLTEVAADVRARLQRVCGNLPPDELDALARQIATITVKYQVLEQPRSVRIPTPP